MEAPRPLSGSWRSLARDLPRGVGLSALIAALAAAAPPVAGAATGPGVVLSGPGVTRGAIPGDELEATSGAPNYTLRSRPGEDGVKVAKYGLPVASLLEKAGIAAPGSIGYLTVPRPDGTYAYLPGVDFGPSPPFPEGPALVSTDVDSTRFFRPVTADPNDVNAADNLASAAGEALRLGVHRGNVLGVSASASASSAAAGQPVTFSAEASNALPGEVVSYRWSFGDGAVAAGAEVSHAFSGSGTFQVRATAFGSEESGGESAPVAVVVGSPPVTAGQPTAAPPKPKPKGKKPGAGAPGGGGRGQSAAAFGHGDAPAKEGGRGPDRGAAGERGADEGSASENEAGGSAPSSPASGPSAPAPVPVAPEASLPVPPPASEAEPTAPANPPAVRAPAKPGDGAEGPELETVEGRLVADSLGPLAAAEEAAAAGAAAGGSSAFASRTDNDGGGASVPVAALVVCALIAAGAGTELRGARRGGR